jgi:IS30 family transposase
MEVKKHRRLSLKERIIIQTLLKEKKTKSYIANRLGRTRSTIGREVNKWVQTKKDIYDAELANWCAKEDYLNKRNLDKISTYSLLNFFVYRGLLSNWTPEQISGRLKELYPNDPIMSISHEAIYRHIYTRPQASLNKKLIKLLVRKKQDVDPIKKDVVVDLKLLTKSVLTIDQSILNLEMKWDIGKVI